MSFTLTRARQGGIQKSSFFFYEQKEYSGPPGLNRPLLAIICALLRLTHTLSLLHVKIKRALAHSNNNQNLTAMTHIMNFAASTTSRSNRMKEYQVEVIDFDGDSHTVYVEARSEEEASDRAAEIVGNADYTMVYEIA